MNLKNRLISIIIAIFITVTLICPVIMAGADGTLTVSASSTEGRIGDTVEITLTVDSNPGFAALLINVKTGDGFELVSAKNGTVMHNMTTGNNILWDSASDSTSTGTLLTLTIKICENARLGDNNIEIKVLECYNSSLKSVNVEIEDLQIKVVGDQQHPETESTVESSAETTETESTIESSAETTEKCDDSTASSDTELDETVTPDCNLGEGETENDDTDNREETTQHANKGGCGSNVVAGLWFILLAPIVCFVKKRK